MSKKEVDIEVFTASFCSACQQASQMMEKVLDEPAFASVTWSEIDVVNRIDYAVACGRLSTPAIVIGGKCIFIALPTEEKLRKAILNHLENEGSNEH